MNLESRGDVRKTVLNRRNPKEEVKNASSTVFHIFITVSNFLSMI
jgi:hypothetical protein